MTFKAKTLAAWMALAVLGATPLVAQETESRLDEWQGEARDAWIDGKLEASYLINTELNNFDIHTQVDTGHVVLSGNVSNETKKQLAEEIARNLDGVVSVENRLMIVAEAGREEVAGTDDRDLDADAGVERDADAGVEGDVARDAEADERNFSTRFHDLTTTARLKSSFAINEELEATSIDIDTYNGVVTLEGEVDTEAKKQLAEEIARGYDHVVRVENRLVVSTEDSVAEDTAAVDDSRA